MSAKTSFKILTLNSISIEGLQRLPRERYEIASEIGHPDAIMVRSAKMHDMVLPESVLAVARAGAGSGPWTGWSRRGCTAGVAPSDSPRSWRR